MSPLNVFSAGRSLKKELYIIISVIGVLMFMPVIVLASAFNLPSIASGQVLYNEVANPQDTYDYGNCTYWASLQRLQIGKAIPNTWGNANTWATRAKADGYLVDHTPEVGAIMQTTAGQWGHVAIVTNVDPLTGSWTISEMNYVGYDEVDSRTFPSALALIYNFIH